MKKSINIFIALIVLLSWAGCKISPSQRILKNMDDGLYAQITTDKGNILLSLEYKLAPGTVANFVALAEGNHPEADTKYRGKHFFDGLTFHRVVKDFVIQGGDPLGTGAGDAGYVFDNEIPKNDKHELLLKHDKPGVVAMANSGPNTNGSQFYITLAPAPHLDGGYSVFGQVVSGQDVVNKIQKGDIIRKITILRKGKDAEKFNAPEEFMKFMKKSRERRKKELEEQEMRRQKSVEFIGKMAGDIMTKKPLAKRLPSGVRMYVEEEGTGKKPVEGTLVYVDYAGFFEDGRLFDTSIVSMAKNFDMYNEQKDRMGAYKPMKIPYSDKARIIQGLREAILTMNYGEKAMVFIPSELAYGKKGAGRGLIPPDTDLIFVVRLLNN